MNLSIYENRRLGSRKPSGRPAKQMRVRSVQHVYAPGKVLASDGVLHDLCTRLDAMSEIDPWSLRKKGAGQLRPAPFPPLSLRPLPYPRQQAVADPSGILHVAAWLVPQCPVLLCRADDLDGNRKCRRKEPPAGAQHHRRCQRVNICELYPGCHQIPGLGLALTSARSAMTPGFVLTSTAVRTATKAA